MTFMIGVPGKVMTARNNNANAKSIAKGRRKIQPHRGCESRKGREQPGPL